MTFGVNFASLIVDSCVRDAIDWVAKATALGSLQDDSAREGSRKGKLKQTTPGQIASREMEIVRIKGALQRAGELSDDVAAAIEEVV